MFPVERSLGMGDGFLFLAKKNVNRSFLEHKSS